MSYRCSVHRRESDGIFDSECPECEYDRKRDEQQVEHARELQAAQLKQSAREARAEQERHRELMEFREREAEAAERHREQLADLEQSRLAAEEARLEAEEEWREAQEREKQEDVRRRELREGLPHFDEGFQDEWARVNERLVGVLQREEEFAQARWAAHEAQRVASVAHNAAVQALSEELANDPPDGLVIPPAVLDAQSAWRRLQAAFAGLLEAAKDSPYARIPRLESSWMGENLFRLWLVARGLGGHGSRTRGASGFQLLLGSYQPRPGFGAIGCAAIVALTVPYSLLMAAAWMADLGMFGLDGVLIHMVAAFLAVLPAAVVGFRAFVGPRRYRELLGALCEFHAAATHAVFGAAAPTRLSRAELERVPDPAARIVAAFGDLGAELGNRLSRATPHWLQQALPTLGARATELARRNMTAFNRVTEADANVVDVEAREAPQEDRRIRANFKFMEAQIRGVGRQILDGIRIPAARIALVRCPACSGPLTPQVAACPYCGSALRQSRS